MDEISLSVRLSVIFSINLVVFSMSSISLWHSCWEVIFIYLEQISYCRSKEEDSLGRKGLSSDLDEDSG